MEINLLIAVLQKVLWKMARINFLNVKKVDWQNNEQLTKYIFAKTSGDNSLIELIKEIKNQEMDLFESQFEEGPQ